jgi:hypothetical protein
MKLDVKALAIACGLLWGGGVFVWTWWMLIFNTATPGDPTMIGTIYLGYTVSGTGSMIGLVWGAVDGALCGALLAFLYNWLVDRNTAGQSPSAPRRSASQK